MKILGTLDGVSRCPQCSVANPLLTKLWGPHFLMKAGDVYGRNWAAYTCSSCFRAILVESYLGNQGAIEVERIYPATKKVADELPERARVFLKQALESLHAPDGAAMLAGSAVDAMLKAKGLVTGSVYERINEAVTRGILTAGMAEWAHEVRLGSNRPRHSDEQRPHISAEEAAQSVEFTKELGNFLFVIPARIEVGKAAAIEAGAKA